MADLHELFAPLIEAAPPPPDLDRLRHRVQTRRRRRIGARVAALLALLAVGTGVLTAMNHDQGQVVAAGGSGVPTGWQMVTAGQAQFAVPGDWTVFANCGGEEPSNAVVSFDGCYYTRQRSTYGLAVAVTSVPKNYPHEFQGVPTSQQTVNGLAVFVFHLPNQPESAYVPQFGITLAFLPFGSPLTSEQQVVADRILSTITVAVDPRPIPKGPSTTGASDRPTALCDAVDAWQTASAGNTGPDGVPTPAQLGLIVAIRNAAPPDMTSDLDTMIRWLQAGAPQPTPTEVTAAGGRSTTAWARYCPSSPMLPPGFAPPGSGFSPPG